MDSLNNHAQSIGSTARIISMSGGRVLSDAEKQANLCTKPGCGKVATHFSNQWGTEKLLCDEHAARCMEKNQNLPADLWFCKRMGAK